MRIRNIAIIANLVFLSVVVGYLVFKQIQTEREKIAIKEDEIVKREEEVAKKEKTIIGKEEEIVKMEEVIKLRDCLLYTSPSPRDQRGSRMPSSA